MTVEDRVPDPGELLESLESALRGDPRLRDLARGFVRWLSGLLADPAQAAEEADQVAQDPAPAQIASEPSEEPAPKQDPPIAAAPDPAPAIRGDSPSWQQEPLPDLDRISARARLKAECCRWAITRRRRLEEGADREEAIRPTDLELGRRARELESCYAWPLDPYASLPTDDDLENLAGCYEALVSAVALVRDLPSEKESGADYREDAYTLLAEVQSALRAGLSEHAQIFHDVDQNDAFLWLRKRVFDTEVYVQRYMRLEDPGDVRQWHDMLRRIDALEEHIEGAARKNREREKHRNKIRYHCQRLARGAMDEEAASDWRTIDLTTSALLECGVPPSNIDLRELLLPLLENMPPEHEVGQGLIRVLAEIDRYLASREMKRPAQCEREASAAVREVAQLLAGKTMVLIGGLERRESATALREAFDLKELRWLSTGSHVSYSTFEPDIARPDTAVVLLAIRWSSHSYTRVAKICEQYDKPFVRLPGGYSPNQVANQILGQVSDRLHR
jgi:hypothetical protein